MGSSEGNKANTIVGIDCEDETIRICPRGGKYQGSYGEEGEVPRSEYQPDKLTFRLEPEVLDLIRQ